MKLKETREKEKKRRLESERQIVLYIYFCS